MPFTVDWDFGGDDEKRRSGSTSSNTISISLQEKSSKVGLHVILEIVDPQ